MFFKKKIAVFVDGPNILRKEFDIDLSVVREKLKKYGEIRIAKVFLNPHAPEKLIEAIVNHGFEVEITPNDTDTAMVADATEAACSNSIDVIALVTRDSDFLPAIIKAKKHGKMAILLMTKQNSSSATKNTADTVIFLRDRNGTSNDKGRKRRQVKQNKG